MADARQGLADGNKIAGLPPRGQSGETDPGHIGFLLLGRQLSGVTALVFILLKLETLDHRENLLVATHVGSGQRRLSVHHAADLLMASYCSQAAMGISPPS